ncbi:MAG: FAD/NAD(P)-binding protein [Methylococcales bacterium]|jgi:sulfhydrogenase subunit gamma (sulfur reductase)|nr:FAD/NAD(P)-binding protein [Methylococcales bacterium]MBT7443700.1 FAD/NAD(P)-binding protein [Methylococcales bacterium]
MIHLPQAAIITERIQETKTIFTLKLRFEDPQIQAEYHFQPGQFNMLYLHGVGEIPISIVSDPKDSDFLQHTIRVVGRVTQGFSRLQAGDSIGVRGAFGSAWPLAENKRKDIIFFTGGLGCAPVVAAIKYVLKRRNDYDNVCIIQGVKHADDLIWRQQYQTWQEQHNVQIYLAADVSSPGWKGHVGPPTELLHQADFDPDNCCFMLCGPQPMMIAVCQQLHGKGVPDNAIWLSLERNMQCGNAQCGHCQIGPLFACKQGPVFNYSTIKQFIGKPGL